MIVGQRVTLFPRIALRAPRSPKPTATVHVSKRAKFLSMWKVCVLNFVQFKDHHSTKCVHEGVYLSKMPHTALFAVAGLGSRDAYVCDDFFLELEENIDDEPLQQSKFYQTKDPRYLAFLTPAKAFAWQRSHDAYFYKRLPPEVLRGLPWTSADVPNVEDPRCDEYVRNWNENDCAAITYERLKQLQPKLVLGIQ